MASVRHRTRSGLNHSGVSSVVLDEAEPLCLPVDFIVCNNTVLICRKVLDSESDLVVAVRREGLRNRPSESAALERIKARVPKPLIKTLAYLSCAHLRSRALELSVNEAFLRWNFVVPRTGAFPAALLSGSPLSLSLSHSLTLWCRIFYLL